MKDTFTTKDIIDRIDRLGEKWDVKFEKIEARMEAQENNWAKAMAWISGAAFTITLIFNLVWKKIVGD